MRSLSGIVYNNITKYLNFWTIAAQKTINDFHFVIKAKWKHSFKKFSSEMLAAFNLLLSIGPCTILLIFDPIVLNIADSNVDWSLKYLTSAKSELLLFSIPKNNNPGIFVFHKQVESSTETHKFRQFCQALVVSLQSKSDDLFSLTYDRVRFSNRIPVLHFTPIFKLYLLKSSSCHNETRSNNQFCFINDENNELELTWSRLQTSSITGFVIHQQVFIGVGQSLPKYRRTQYIKLVNTTNISLNTWRDLQTWLSMYSKMLPTKPGNGIVPVDRHWLDSFGPHNVLSFCPPQATSNILHLPSYSKTAQARF